MIGFFVNDGGYTVDSHRPSDDWLNLWAAQGIERRLNPISTLLSGERGYANIIKRDMAKSYSAYDLILIAYYLEACISNLDWMGGKMIKVGNLSTKEKAIQVNIRVPEAIVWGSVEACRAFMVESTRQAVELVAPRFALRKVRFDKEALLADLDKVNELFIRA